MSVLARDHLHREIHQSAVAAQDRKQPAICPEAVLPKAFAALLSGALFFQCNCHWFNWSGLSTRSIIARAITEIGLFSTNLSKTGLNMMSPPKDKFFMHTLSFGDKGVYIPPYGNGGIFSI